MIDHRARVEFSSTKIWRDDLRVVRTSQTDRSLLRSESYGGAGGAGPSNHLRTKTGGTIGVDYPGCNVLTDGYFFFSIRTSR
jgi:hypothetical protein